MYGISSTLKLRRLLCQTPKPVSLESGMRKLIYLLVLADTLELWDKFLNIQKKSWGVFLLQKFGCNKLSGPIYYIGFSVEILFVFVIKA